MFKRCSWRLTHDRLPIIRTGGIYPTWAPEHHLQRIHQVFAKQIVSINSVEPSAKQPFVPPLLEDGIQHPIGAWPQCKQKQKKIFAHLFSGSHLHSSDLEGSNYGEMAFYFRAWFHHFLRRSQSAEIRAFSERMIPLLDSLICQQSEIDQLRIHGPKNFEALEAFSDQWRKKVLSQPEGEPYLMLGGWAGRPGHAMLYEFTKRGNTFDFSVFNTGGGSEFHASLVQGTKQKISPLVFFRSIPISNLSASFFQALIEPQVLPVWEVQGILSDKEIPRFLYTLFYSLGGRQENPSSGLVGYITTQRAGTCAADSLLAYFRFRSTSLERFEQMRLNILSGALQQAWQSWKDEIEDLESLSPVEQADQDDKNNPIHEVSEYCSLLDQSARMLVSQSVKPHFLKRGGPWFSKMEAQTAQSISNDILLNTRLSHNRWRLKTSQNRPHLDWIQAARFGIPATQHIFEMFLRNQSNYQPLIQTQHRFSVSLLQRFDHQTITPAQMGHFLKNQLKNLNVSSNQWSRQEVQEQIQWLAEKLPVPTIAEDDYWSRVPKEEILSCMKSIHEIAGKYYNSFKQDSIATTPEQQNVIFTFMAVQHALAIQYEKTLKVSSNCRLSEYQIADPSKLQEGDPYLVFFNPRILKRRQEIREYFAQFNQLRRSQPILHEFDKAFAPLNKEGMRSSLLNREEFKYYMRLGAADCNWVNARATSMALHEAFTEDFSKGEINAFKALLDPIPFYQGIDKEYLGFLRACAFYSFLGASNFSTTNSNVMIDNWLMTRDMDIGCVQFIYKYAYGAFFAGFVFFNENGTKYTSYLPTWNHSARLHTKGNYLVDSSQKEKGSPPIRETKEYALRPQLKTEAVSLPDFSSRNVQEPLARPLHVLDAAEHSIGSFRDPKVRDLFLIDLLRSDLLDRSGIAFTTPFQLLCEDPNFVQRCSDLIQKGVQYFWMNCQKSDRDLLTTLYFVRLGQLIHPWLPKTADVPKIFDQETWREWIRDLIQKETTLLSEQAQALRMLFLLSYEDTPAEKISDSQMVEILTFWFSLDRNIETNACFNCYSTFKFTDVVLGHLSLFYTRLLVSPELQDRIGKAISGAISPTLVRLKWKFRQDFGLLFASSERDEFCIDLQKRSLLWNGSETYQSLSLPQSMEHIVGRNRLFGNRSSSLYICSTQGNHKKCTFEDPIWGFMEMGYRSNRPYIVRTDTDGRRYLHCPKLNDWKGQIPLSIQYQSVFWLPLQDGSMEVDLTRPCLLSDPETGKILYRFTKEKGLTREGVLSLTPTQAPLLRIESKDVVLSWKHEKEGMAHIEYPFYFSMHGQPLCFDFASDVNSRKRRAFWRENPEYVLSEQQPLGLVGNFSQYIVLEHVATKRKKLIIPCIQVSKEKKLSQYPFMQRFFSEVDPDGKISGKQDAIDPKAHIFAFDWIDGRLHAHSQIEKLFLSYLHLAERNYSLALQYIEDIPLFNRMSQEEWGYALPILKWMDALGDRSVDAIAILLRSHTLIREVMFSPHNFLGDNDIEAFLKLMGQRYSAYLEGANHGLSIFELINIDEKRWRNVLDPALSQRSFIRFPSTDSEKSVALKGEEVPKDLPIRWNPATTLSPEGLSPHANQIQKSYLISNYLSTYEQDFYIFYDKIINSSSAEREKILYYLLCRRLCYISKKSEVPFALDLLIAACLVEKPSNLEKPLRYSKVLDSSAPVQVYIARNKLERDHFEKVVQSIRRHASSSKLSRLIGASSHPFIPPAIKGPLNSLKLEFSENQLVPLRKSGRELDLESIPSLRIDFASHYFEKQSPSLGEEEFNSDPDWENIISLGREARKDAIRYRLKQNADLRLLRTELLNRRQEIFSQVQILEDKILSHAYPVPIDIEMQKKEEVAMLSGHYPFTQNISTLVGLFLEGTYEAFANALPQCSPELIANINRDLQMFLVQKAHLQQLDRSLQKLDPFLNTSEMDSYAIHDLAAELFAECTFPSAWRPGLVFEYASDKRLRPKQVEYLRNIISTMEGSHPFVLSHMIMGGGKTDVFASLLGRLWARKDRLSLFLTPASQLKTVQGNLATSQWRHFRQGVCTFDYSRQELTLKVLKYIHTRLMEAMERQEMVILRSEMPQILELEYVYLVCQPHQDTARIRVLKDILTIFRNQTCAIVDETDEVLRVDRETNFPSGERISPEKNRVAFISFLYHKLVSDPYLLNRLKLIENEQESMSEKMYREELLPYLSKLLVSHPVFMGLPQELKISFEKYLCDDLDPHLEPHLEEIMKKSISATISAAYHEWIRGWLLDPFGFQKTRTEGLLSARSFVKRNGPENPRVFQQFRRSLEEFSTLKKSSPKIHEQDLDLAFLQWRDQMAKKSPEVAHLMGLARHLLQDILPLTLRKKTDRNYGRKSIDRGKVVPYVATKVPGSTEYGNPWELIAYHFQTAISTPYSKELISQFIQTQKAAIRQESISYGVAFNKTPLARQFEKVFGIPIQNAENMEEVTRLINADVAKRLYVEEALIGEEVTYDPYYYSSNGHNLMMFPKTMIMTGTPYNRRSYPMKFSKKALLDPGSEGALMDLLIERRGEIHKVSDSGDLREILKRAKQHSKHAKKIRAVIDVGGCLLKQDNEAYARDVLSVFENDSSINGVVFFRMIRDKEGVRKHLALLKKGHEEPIVLRDTHVSTWKAQGVDPSSLFFLYDQWHSRGTDFPLPLDAVAITILGAEDPLHDVLQGVARLRKLHQSQDVIYAISESVIRQIKESEGISDIDIKTLLQRSYRIEKEKLRDHIFRHYIQELQDVVRSEHLQKLLRSPWIGNDRGDRNLLMRSQEESLYESFGKLKKEMSPIAYLEQMAKSLTATYRKEYPTIASKFLQILNDARSQLEHLPTFVSSSQKTLGREQQLQIALEKEQEEEKENEREVELQKEWLSYQDPPKGNPVLEKQWVVAQADSLRDQKGERLELSSCGQRIDLLGSILSNYAYANPFPSIFDRNLLATNNWNVSHTTPVSIFNKHHKPSQQLLVIEHGPQDKRRVSGILLSLAESEFFRLQWFPKQSKDIRMWLIDAGGHFLNRTTTPLPETEGMEDLLVQMNLLNGHSDWLIQNLGRSLLWFYKDPKSAKLKFHFLHLQARRHLDKEKMALLLAHPMLKYHPDGIRGLIQEETLGLVTKELLPYVPENLRNHRNLPSSF